MSVSAFSLLMEFFCFSDQVEVCVYGAGMEIVDIKLNRGIKD